MIGEELEDAINVYAFKWRIIGHRNGDLPRKS
jgi:hypothetical protein